MSSWGGPWLRGTDQTRTWALAGRTRRARAKFVFHDARKCRRHRLEPSVISRRHSERGRSGGAGRLRPLVRSRQCPSLRDLSTAGGAGKPEGPVRGGFSWADCCQLHRACPLPARALPRCRTGDETLSWSEVSALRSLPIGKVVSLRGPLHAFGVGRTHMGCESRDRHMFPAAMPSADGSSSAKLRRWSSSTSSRAAETNRASVARCQSRGEPRSRPASSCASSRSQADRAGDWWATYSSAPMKGRRRCARAWPPLNGYNPPSDLAGSAPGNAVCLGFI